MEIDNYMTVNEAAEKWGVGVESVKQRLKPSRNKHLDDDIKNGLIKFYLKPNGQRKEWIISKDFMEKYYKKNQQNS